MNYADIKVALSSSLPGVWPDTPNVHDYFYVVDPKSPPSRPIRVKLDALEGALQRWIPGAPFTDLVKGLPPELQDLIEKLTSELVVDELGISTGSKSDGHVSVTGFNFTLAVDFASPPTICGLVLKEIALELNLVVLGGALIWNPILIASCQFLRANCAVSIELFARSVTLMLSQTDAVGVDTILGQASPGTNLSSLQKQMEVSSSGDAPKIKLFMATAQLAASPVFSCALVLDLSATRLKWQAFSLSGLAVAFEHGGDVTVFSFAVSTLVGGYELDAALTYDSALKATTFNGSLSTKGASLKEFWDDFSKQLRVVNPVKGHWPVDLELSGVSIALKKMPDGFTYEIDCGGRMAFDELGTSLRFEFKFNKDGRADHDAVTLQLDSLVFTLKDSESGLVFSYVGSETLSLASLVRLAQLYPLYGIADDIHFTLTKGVLVFAPRNDAGHHVLFGLEVSFDATLTNNVLQMLTGAERIGISSATLYAANTAWSVDELAQISSSALSPNTPVPKGLSVIAALTIGSEQINAPLVPPVTNNTGTTSTSPPPEGVNSPDTARWFKVQKQAGPVYLERIGLKLGRRSDGAKIDFLCDGCFTLGPLTITLDGFSVDVPFHKPSGFAVSLHGLNVTYDKPPLLISGGFLNQGGNLYIGDLEVRTKALFLSAIGEYSNKYGYTSLALFAALTEPPLGGPVSCYVTGLAAGGGYNSSLRIPTSADQVPRFALIEAAASTRRDVDPFKVIENCIEPKQGEDWIAVGLLFKSFEIVQSIALLTVAFGENFQLAILGQSEISMPPASKTRIAYAQVDVEGHYDPRAGLVSVEGLLTPNSYVLSKDCHILGGFAVILNESGDFVVSFGGYPIDFDYASRGYPAVPRLELIWNIDAHTSVKGATYFAMTPAAMMEGGFKQATWNCGIFSAWFTLTDDILIQWRPFYFQATFSMSLGVSFDLKIALVHVHFTVHIGAECAIAGPPFHGHAHIDLSVISFDVEFGNALAKPAPLSWTEFRQLLPGYPGNDANRSDLISVKVTDGLEKDLTQSRGRQQSLTALESPQPDWVVNGTHFRFAIQSSLPITNASTGQVTVIETPKPVSIGILPMEKKSAQGTFDILITDPDGHPVKASADPKSRVVATSIETDMAFAHWGTQPPENSNTSPVKCTAGYVVSGGRPEPDKTSPIALSILLADMVKITAISDRSGSSTPFSV